MSHFAAHVIDARVPPDVFECFKQSMSLRVQLRKELRPPEDDPPALAEASEPAPVTSKEPEKKEDEADIPEQEEMPPVTQAAVQHACMLPCFCS